MSVIRAAICSGVRLSTPTFAPVARFRPPMQQMPILPEFWPPTWAPTCVSERRLMIRVRDAGGNYIFECKLNFIAKDLRNMYGD